MKIKIKPNDYGKTDILFDDKNIEGVLSYNIKVTPSGTVLQLNIDAADIDVSLKAETDSYGSKKFS